jgi:hypothetical protein
MAIYYFLYFLLTLFALYGRDTLQRKKFSILLGLWWFVLVLFAGLRDEVGGDWGNYAHYFVVYFPYMSYTSALFHGDPAFWLLGKCMYEIGWGLYGVDVVVAIIFMVGLYRLLLQQPNPWLGLAVAFPYLFVVVSMGYLRQAAAIGLMMLGISYLKERKFTQFLLSLFFAVTFHKTAVLMVGIGLFQEGRGKMIRFTSIILVGIGLWSAFLAQEQATLIQNYIEAQMQSSGALIRVLMNAIPALLLFMFRRRWKRLFNDYAFWSVIALGSLLALVGVGFASTAVDRMALYMLPLQVVLFSRLPLLLKPWIPTLLTKWVILFYYGLVLVVWLNFATHAHGWVYHTLLLKGF